MNRILRYSLLSVVMMLCGLAYGQTTATLDFTGSEAYGMTLLSGTTNDYNDDPYVCTEGDVTLTLTGKTRWWKATKNNELRFYKDSGFKLAVPAGNVITKIALTATSPANFSSTVGTYADGVWTGALQEVPFTCTITKSNTPITKIEVTYQKSDAPVKKDPALAFSAKAVEATVGEAFTAPTLTKATDAAATYTSGNEAVATVDAATGAVTIVAVGTTTITATVAETADYAAGNASYTLTVSPAKLSEVNVPYTESFKDGIGSFTTNDVKLDEGLTYVWAHDKNYGCMKASAYAGSNKASESWLISPVINMTSDKGALTFEHAVNKYFADVTAEATLWIRIEGGDWKQYKLSYPAIAAGKSFSDFAKQTVDLAEFGGKKIQVAFKYVSSKDAAGTWEIKNVSVVGEMKDDPALAFSETAVNVTLGEAFTAPTLTKATDAAVVYSTSNEKVATVDAATGAVTIVAAGTAKITAKAEATEKYAAGEASYTITVVAPALPEVSEPYTETFEAGIGSFTIDDVTLSEGLSYVWKHDSSYKYMKASAYAGGSNKASESWLISPVIELSSADVVRYLSFDQCISKFFGDVTTEATLWIRNEGGQWNQLQMTYPELPASGNWSAFEKSIIPLDGYEGSRIQVGFKYVSTAEAAGTWEIRNFCVSTTDPTGIDTVKAGKTIDTNAIYNLAGQRLAKPAKGINIIGGKKVIVK